MSDIDFEVGQRWALLTSDGKPCFAFELLAKHPKRDGYWIGEPLWSALKGQVKPNQIEVFEESYVRKFMKHVPDCRIVGRRCIV